MWKGFRSSSHTVHNVHFVQSLTFATLRWPTAPILWESLEVLTVWFVISVLSINLFWMLSIELNYGIHFEEQKLLKYYVPIRKHWFHGFSCVCVMCQYIKPQWLKSAVFIVVGISRRKYVMHAQWLNTSYWENCLTPHPSRYVQSPKYFDNDISLTNDTTISYLM